MKHPPVQSGTLFEKDLIRRVLVQAFLLHYAPLPLTGWASVPEIIQRGRPWPFVCWPCHKCYVPLTSAPIQNPFGYGQKAPNPWLVISFAVSALLMACILFIPTLQSVFRLTWLDSTQWWMVFGLAALSIVQVEVVKAINKFRK